VNTDARAWLAAQGVAEPRVVRPLSTASTAKLFAVDDLVLRWYGTGTFLDVEPDAVVREVAALGALADTQVPAPRLVAWSAEPPALLMTRLPGDHRLDAREPAAVQHLLDMIHAVPRGPLARWSYRGYHEGRDLPAPPWWRDRAVWVRAVRWSSAGPPPFEPVVIHRDFHPGNLLWTDAAISGVVDWGNACLGPAAFDLAHYRVNVASLVGPEVADHALPGEPAWDIEAALGYLDLGDVDGWTGPWPHLSRSTARKRLETFIARAVASLG
jgi:aminoglycoside phosphotransferase (APT) family kinase protein